MFKGLKNCSTSLVFIGTADKRRYDVSIVVYLDASRPKEHAQLSYVAGLLFKEMEMDSVVRLLAWSPHKSRRPMESIDSNEIRADGDGDDV